MGAITDAERAQVRAGSPVGGKYDNAVNRESAAEMLAARRVAVEPDAKATDKPSRTAQADDGERGIGDVMKDALFGTKRRSEEHTSELQSLMRISYAVFCLKKK